MIRKEARHGQDAWFAEVYAEADEAGKKAAAAIDPRQFGCGFAWVIVNGNSAFGLWVKKHRGWQKSIPGVCVSTLETITRAKTTDLHTRARLQLS